MSKDISKKRKGVEWVVCCYKELRLELSFLCEDCFEESVLFFLERTSDELMAYDDFVCVFKDRVFKFHDLERKKKCRVICFSDCYNVRKYE